MGAHQPPDPVTPTREPESAIASSGTPSKASKEGSGEPKRAAATSGSPTQIRNRGRRLATNQRVHFLGGFTGAYALLLTALLSAGGAFLIFPKDDPVTSHGPVSTVGLSGGMHMYAFNVAFAPNRSVDGTDVVISALSKTDPKTPEFVALTVPGTTWAAGCDHLATCESAGPSYLKVATFRFRQPTILNTAFGPYYEARIRMTVPGAGFGASWNDAFASVSLPDLTVQERQPDGTWVYQRASGLVGYHVPAASRYAWGTGDAPTVIKDLAQWTVTTSDAYNGEKTVNGASVPIQNQDARMTFLAGALLGVSGGALVGAIQEAASSVGRRQRRKDDSLNESA
jgi:hypothetical protein